MKKLTIFLLMASCTGLGSHAAAGMTDEWEDDTSEFSAPAYRDSVRCTLKLMHDDI